MVSLYSTAMQIAYRNVKLERAVIIANVCAAVLVIGSFVSLFGFYEPLLPASVLYTVQAVLFGYFVAEKVVRAWNAESKLDFLRFSWFDIALLLILAIVLLTQHGRSAGTGANSLWHIAIGAYLVLQVVTKVCRTTVHLASLGTNPTRMLIASFLVLIIVGAGVLCLPRASYCERLSFVDALFTATSATCVTGLVVRDTGSDFSLMGQVVILGLIQLGGLGIVVFGAVISLLLGQAFSMRESAAMKDLINAQTLNRIGNMIAFIFVATLLIEALGAVCLYPMWAEHPGWIGNAHEKWFYSVFHSISAFCNAGFGLFSDSLIGYQSDWGVYGVIAPLIILGGLGFGVLYNVSNVTADRIKRFFKRRFNKQYRMYMEAPKRISLQSKIALSMSFLLIIIGAVLILLFEHCSRRGSFSACPRVLDALFQSITARTAGFNTVNIGDMNAPSRLVLILLMFIGGSPGSTAGGIKTVTLAVIVMTVITTLRKRGEVEMFRRSIHVAVVGRAVTIALLFVFVLFLTIFALSITEQANSDIALSDIVFEATSALATVGLTTGITPLLTTSGKLIIIVVMLIGRLGPLTLLAALTFDLKSVKYNYPQEAIIVG